MTVVDLAAGYETVARLLDLPAAATRDEQILALQTRRAEQLDALAAHVPAEYRTASYLRLRVERQAEISELERLLAAAGAPFDLPDEEDE